MDRWGSPPVRRIGDSLDTGGRIVVMLVEAAVGGAADLRRGRFPVREFVRQAWFVTRVAAVPTVLVTLPFGVIISIQVGSLAQQLGATSFVGAANGLGIVRQGAPIVVALLMAGAVGSAICADLGSRTIREEIAAMEVMGISPVRRLVVPRAAAAVLVAALLCGIVIAAGVGTGLLFNLVAQGGTAGSYLSSFAAFARPPDLAVAVAKSAVFGFVAAVVAGYKGLSASGGPRGVADAVNASVVLSVVLLFATNLLITQIWVVVFGGSQ